MDNPNIPQNGFIEMLKQNKRLLLVVGPLALTLLVVIFAIIFMQNSVSPTANNVPTQQPPTPTPNQTLQAQKLNIQTVSPLNNASGISLFTPISITFKSAFSKSEQEKMQITIAPTVQGTISWSLDNKTLTFRPLKALRSQTNYTASVTSTGGTFSWNFQTVSDSALSEEDIMKLEQQSAEDTKQQQAAFNKNYPWWDNFPLQAEQYFVYFDPDTKKFVGLLYPSTSAATSQDAQVNAMKTEILSRIQRLGIDVNQYGIEWKVTPEP